MDIIQIFKFLLVIFINSVLIYKISINYKFLYDNNLKKFHKQKALNIGGLIILINILISIYFFKYPETINNILVFAFPLFFLGFFDDLKQMSPTSRIFIQFLLIYFIINEYQLDLTNLGSYEAIGIIELGTFSKIFTSLCVIMIINSSNYNDGIDGWSNISYIISNTFIILLLISFNQYEFINIPIILILVSIPALIFNFGKINKIKIFLGNGGSIILGYFLAMEILYYEKNTFGIHPIIFASILSYNVYEFLSVNIHRLKRKKNIFTGGKDHFHYLVYYYFSENIYVAILILSITQIFLTTVTVMFFYLFGYLFALLIFIFQFLLFLKLRSYLIIRTNI